MTSTVTPLQPDTKPINITDEHPALNVHFGFLGISKQVRRSEIAETNGQQTLEGVPDAPIETTVNKEFLSVSKRLLESSELTAIRSADTEMKQWIKKKALPSFFRGGIFLIPFTLVTEVEAKLKEYAEKRQALVEAFIAVYAQRRTEAQAQLRDLFHSKDYPSEAKVRLTFEFEWEFFRFQTPTKFKEISAQFFEEQEKKAVSKWKGVSEEITAMLTAEMSDFVTKFAEQLTPGEDGKKRRVTKAAAENLKEFLANVNARNVTNDQQLAKLVNDAKALCDGLDVKEIKSNEAVKDGLAKGFSAIKEQLNLLVEQAGSRAIELE